jgi:RND family efflux transporter MFP subunit
MSCERAPGPVEATPAKLIAVTSATASIQDWPAVYDATGTVRARTTAVISAKVTGYIEQVLVRAGDRVRAGQPLVVLDARDLETGVRRAEAVSLELRSAVPEADNAVAAAKASLELAQATFRRMEDLHSKRSISNQEFDEASARLKSAKAQYEMARARRQQIDSKAVQVDQEVRAAGITRDFARIAAPFAGVVVSRTAEPGALATPGAPLLTIEQEGVYRLEAAIDESRVPSVAMGQAVEVTVDSLDSRITARVSEVGAVVDPASRSYIAKLDLPPSPRLRSGMFGRASFPTGAEKRLAVPAAALIERGQLQSVFVIGEGIVHTRLITAGRRSAERVEVLSGLQAGERIVISPPADLRDGDPVEVRP